MPPSSSSEEQSTPPPNISDSAPFAHIGRLVSLPGYRNVEVKLRDYVQPGESLEEAADRVSRLVDARIAADIRKMRGEAPLPPVSIESYDTPPA